MCPHRAHSCELYCGDTLITSFPDRRDLYERKRTNRPQQDDRIAWFRPALARDPFLICRPSSSFGLRPFRHVFDIEILDDEKDPVRIYGEGPGGLVDHVLSHILRVFEGPGEPGLGLLPVLRPFLLPGEFSLPAFPDPLLLLHTGFLDRGKVDPPPIAGHHRNHHAPVEAQGLALKLLFRKHSEPGDRVLLLRFRKAVVRGEGDEPLPRLDRDVKRGGTGIRGMGLEGQNPEREKRSCRMKRRRRWWKTLKYSICRKRGKRIVL